MLIPVSTQPGYHVVILVQKRRRAGAADGGSLPQQARVAHQVCPPLWKHIVLIIVLQQQRTATRKNAECPGKRRAQQGCALPPTCQRKQPILVIRNASRGGKGGCRWRHRARGGGAPMGASKQLLTRRQQQVGAKAPLRGPGLRGPGKNGAPLTRASYRRAVSTLQLCRGATCCDSLSLA